MNYPAISFPCYLFTKIIKKLIDSPYPYLELDVLYKIAAFIFIKSKFICNLSHSFLNIILLKIIKFIIKIIEILLYKSN